MSGTPEEIRERKRLYQRAYRDKDREALHRRNGEYYERHREEIRTQQGEHYERNREAVLSQQREYYQANREQRLTARMRRVHGPFISADWAAMWDQQEGRCYLCRRELTGRRAIIDHDHGCCPEERSCRSCRRGLACDQCNIAVGMAADDPARLRRIADNLETAQQAVAARLRSEGQLSLLETGS
jgi:hypothetical protein